MSEKWTFLSHHAHVLIALSKSPELTMDELARIEGITTRSVMNVINDLVSEGYVTKSKRGRKNHYEIDMAAPLRHKTSANHTVGELITSLGQVKGN